MEISFSVEVFASVFDAVSIYDRQIRASEVAAGETCLY